VPSFARTWQLCLLLLESDLCPRRCHLCLRGWNMPVQMQWGPCGLSRVKTSVALVCGKGKLGRCVFVRFRLEINHMVTGIRRFWNFLHSGRVCASCRFVDIEGTCMGQNNFPKPGCLVHWSGLLWAESGNWEKIKIK
jgi:hypothetical protein